MSESKETSSGEHIHGPRPEQLLEQLKEQMTDPGFRKFLLEWAHNELKPKCMSSLWVVDGNNSKSRHILLPRTDDDRSVHTISSKPEQKILSKAERLRQWFLKQDPDTAQKFTDEVLAELQAEGSLATSLCKDAELLLVLPDSLTHRLYERYVLTKLLDESLS